MDSSAFSDLMLSLSTVLVDRPSDPLTVSPADLVLRDDSSPTHSSASSDSDLPPPFFLPHVHAPGISDGHAVAAAPEVLLFPMSAAAVLVQSRKITTLVPVSYNHCR